MRICGKTFNTTNNKKMSSLEIRQGSMSDKDFKKVIDEKKAYEKECKELWDYYEASDWYVEL